MDAPTQTSISGLCRRGARRPPDTLDERLALVATCRELGAPIEPAMLGRFAVVRSLGRGGQGCVYEGFDPSLQRPVALKIPRFAHGPAHDDLAFEARALAQVRHPHLVTVYALERCEGRPVVVMELVVGTPLMQWIAASSPSVARILDVIAKVGDGLSELHRCGLTHRDVKPANLLIDAHGQPRLVDLGLAAYSGMSAGAGGTPSFAAPEQRERTKADPAADQYGLAATLLTALGGDPTLGAASMRGPASVRAAIARALSEDPSERHTDVAAFVRALRVGSRRRRQLARAGAFGFAIAAVAFAAIQDPSSQCARDPQELRHAIDREDAALRDHFAAMKSAAGVESLAPTLAALDDHAQRWSEAVTSLCAAPSSAVWEGARAQCLDDGAHAVGTLLGELVVLDEPSVMVAPLLVVALPSPERCTDAELEHLGPVVDHAATLAVRRALSAAQQRCHYGLTPDCAVEYDALAQTATSLGVDPCIWQPVLDFERVMSAQYSRGAEDTASALREVQWSAQACGRDDVKLDAERVLAEHIAAQGDADGAEQVLRGAESTLARLGRPPSDEIAVLASRAVVMTSLGRPRLAADAAARALALHRALRGGSDEQRAQLLGMYSGALHETGEDTQALALQADALELRRHALGPRHPSVAHELANLAVSYERIDVEKARAFNREAVEIFEANVKGHELPLAMCLTHQAGFDLEAGDTSSAWTAIERGLAMFAAADAADHAFAGDALLIRARLLQRDGELDRALADAEAAVTRLERTRGPDDATTLAALADLGDIHGDRGDDQLARTLRCRAADGWRAQFGPEHPLSAGFARKCDRPEGA